MFDFINFLQSEDRRAVSQHQQEVVSPVAREEKKETNADIEILTDKYGTLVSGMTIKMELQEACKPLNFGELIGSIKILQELFRNIVS